jgi:hypothetical protein
MSKHIPAAFPLDHPEIIAIAVDVTLSPSRRAYYSSRVLMLADAAMERIQLEFAKREVSQNDPVGPPLSTPI